MWLLNAVEVRGNTYLGFHFLTLSAEIRICLILCDHWGGKSTPTLIGTQKRDTEDTKNVYV